MSIVKFNFESQYLGNNHAISVILPDMPMGSDPKSFYGSGKKYKVLWLLHGTFGDHSDWLRKSMIELYAQEKQIIVVMPSGWNADYTNWDSFAMGFRMSDYLTEELMPIIYNWFPASDKKEDNFIAGLSMGGRGTLKYLLWNTDKFAAGAALSAVPRNLRESSNSSTGMPLQQRREQNQIDNAGGMEGFLQSTENSWDRVLELHAAGQLPRLMIACGEADRLYTDYLKFKALCEEKKIDVHFFSLPNLAHEWRFWDKAIQEALEFFGL